MSKTYDQRKRAGEDHWRAVAQGARGLRQTAEAQGEAAGMKPSAQAAAVSAPVAQEAKRRRGARMKP
jgi:hypothetical protein